MADDLTPQLGECQDPFSKAREILNGLSVHRLDPRRIKMTENEPRASGGQATISVGIIVPPYQLAKWLPEELLKYFLEAQFAIKKFEWDRADVEQSAKAFKSFVNEVSVMATISHPNVVSLIGFVEDMQKGDAWIVLPWEPNGNVREFLQSGEWDIPERISLIQDVVEGVNYLHNRDPPICHGDLKSLNILVNQSYRAMITDFGSARIQGGLNAAEKGSVPEVPDTALNDAAAERLISPRVKLNGTTLELTLSYPGFSLRWTAPEVLDDGVQDMPSDMWAVGWICWEIVTGKFPFEELKHDAPIISRVVKGELPAIRDDAQLSQIGMLCSLMSDSWLSKPAKRINASTFHRKLSYLPSTSPSSSASGNTRVRSAILLNELGRMYHLQDNTGMAESHFRSAADIAVRTENKRAEAVALNGLGHVYRALAEYQKAEEAFREAYEVNSRIGDDLGTANSLDSLGWIYSARAQYQLAEQNLREAHEIHSRIGNDLGAANTLYSMGEYYRVRAEYQKAEQAFSQAHEIQSRIDNDLGAANALIGLGGTYLARSENQRAEQAFREAHQIHCRIKHDPGAASALHGLGLTYSARSENQRAEQAFKEAYEIQSRTGNQLDAGNSLHGLGEIYRARSEYEKAEQAFREAHEIHSRIGNDRGAANALLGLGDIHRARLDYQKAEQALREAHKIHSSIDNSLDAANVLNSLGKIYRARSENERAEQAFREAHQIHSCIGNDLGAANALNGLGEVYFARSESQRALQAFEEAHEIHSRIGEKEGAADALHGLGLVYSAQSDYHRAEQTLREAHEIHSRIGNDRGAASALTALGEVHRARSEYQKAEQAFRESHEIHSRIHNDGGVAVALHGLGEIYRVRSEIERAEQAFMEAHDIHSRIHNDRGVAVELFSLGEIYLTRLENQRAEDAFRKSHEIHSRIGDDMNAAYALHSLGGIYRARSEIRRAEQAFREAHGIHTRIGNKRGTAYALLGLGEIFRTRSEYQRADEALNAAYDIYSCLGDNIGIGKALRSLAGLRHLQCKYEEMEMFSCKALSAAPPGDVSLDSAGILLSLGLARLAQYKYSQAEEAFNEALAAFISIGHGPGQTAASSFISICQLNKAELADETIRMTAAALQAGQNQFGGAMLNGNGNTHHAQVMHAMAGLPQAMQISPAEVREKAPKFLSVGRLCCRLGRLDEAKECFAEARAAYCICADEAGEAKALDGLMTVHALQGKVGDVRVACISACQIYARTGRKMSKACAMTWKFFQLLEVGRA